LLLRRPAHNLRLLNPSASYPACDDKDTPTAFGFLHPNFAWATVPAGITQSFGFCDILISWSFALAAPPAKTAHGIAQMTICVPQPRLARVMWAAACLAVGQFVLIPLSGTRAIADEDVQSNRIRIEYAQPKSPEIEPYYQLVMQRKALEKVQELFSPLMLPSEITVRATECGVSTLERRDHRRVPASWCNGRNDVF
jgi:hypothetical protein